MNKVLRVFLDTVKTKVKIHWILLLLLLVIIGVSFPSIENPGLFITAFFIVYLHELGHIFAAKWYNIPTNKVYLNFFGGLADIDISKIKDNKHTLIISVAGPLVNLAVLLFLVAISTIYSSAFIQSLIAFNIIMLVFNLLPIYPLDGGRILRSSLRLMKVDILKTNKITLLLTRIVSCIGSIIAFYNGFYFAAAILVFLLLIVNDKFITKENLV